jgi:hypothetical protein
MSTSVAYLRKRLAAIGRHDLLAAAEAGQISTLCAAEEAGLVRTARSRVTGNGSENQAKRRAWAIARITRQAAPLGPKPDPQPAPEIGPEPARPKLSQETRDIIARLVEAGRADLVIAVAERRISPFQAARIADRGGHRRTVPEEKAESVEPEAKKKPPPRIDVRALIG